MVNADFAYLFTPPCKRYAKSAFTTFAQIYSPVCTNLHHICTEQIWSKSIFSASENNSNDLLLSHTLLDDLRKLERCCSRSLALITYTEEVLHIPCLTKPASILCSQVHPEPLAMTLSRLGCCPLLWRDYFDPSFSSPMPVILAWFPSFVLWVIFDLCRYGNTKRVMLTKFAGMQ